MFFGIQQTYTTDIYGFYFEEYMLEYLSDFQVKTLQVTKQFKKDVNRLKSKEIILINSSS